EQRPKGRSTTGVVRLEGYSGCAGAAVMPVEVGVGAAAYAALSPCLACGAGLRPDWGRASPRVRVPQGAAGCHAENRGCHAGNRGCPTVPQGATTRGGCFSWHPECRLNPPGPRRRYLLPFGVGAGTRSGRPPPGAPAPGAAAACFSPIILSSRSAASVLS